MPEEVLHKIVYFTEAQLQNIALPQRFTFPFFYEPHALTRIAAADLQNYLLHQTDWEHNFGLRENQEGMIIGKMFGVLVVQDKQGKIGYLSAFSGKLAGNNHHQRFVPPVFDMLEENSFFLQEETVLNALNAQIITLENDSELKVLKDELNQSQIKFEAAILSKKESLKNNKKTRQIIREEKKEQLSPTEFDNLEKELIKQSLHDKHQLSVLQDEAKQHIHSIQEKIQNKENIITQLKKERKEKSGALQQRLFEQYTFLNKAGQAKSLGAIFSETAFGKPPAAAGECATPKLLQFAFLNQLTPLAMAEFWWGASPKSEIRKHQQFYPACNGKCKPILKHMLDGIELDENPMLQHAGKEKELEVIYEDEALIIVNKPAELLSVPGIEVQDSVFTRLQQYLFPVEPIVVHRLDMATSGILIVAKTKEAHKHLQKQFLKQTIKKRYVALLEGSLAQSEGEIKLPLRGDLDDRPRQMVCYEHGKKSLTFFKKIEEKEGKTKVHFWPLTGRTHQLRMHAAHVDGLNAPIIGDDLYGKSSDRLYLHAAEIEFVHPTSLQKIIFEVKEDF